MRGTRTPDPPLRLRPTGAPAVAALALVLVAVLGAGVPGGTRTVGELLLVACPAAALAAAFLLPVLVVDGHGLDVVGVLRRRRVPWDAVVEVRQGWFVELGLADGSRVVCLAAPVVGSMTAFRTLDEDENDLFSRRSAEHPAFPGARGSLALELVAARRPARPATATGPGGGVLRTGRPGAALLLGALALVWAAALTGLV